MSYQMNTNMTRFRSFSKIKPLSPCDMDVSSLSTGRVNQTMLTVAIFKPPDLLRKRYQLLFFKSIVKSFLNSRVIFEMQ